MSNRGQAASLDEQAGVRHLRELGYQDPFETAAQEAARRRAQESQLSRAAELLNAGDPTAAIGILERAVAGDNAWTAGRHWLARAYFRAGRLRETEALLHWLEVHGVEHAELALMRASISLQRRDLDQALDWAVYAGCLQDPLPEANALIGDIHFRRGQLEQAEEAFRLAANQHSPAALAGLGAIALRQGQLDVAADRLLSAIEQDMGLWRAHYRLAHALMRMNRYSEARVALATAARLRPQLAGPYRHLAHIAAFEGDASQAAEYKARASEVIHRRKSHSLLAGNDDRY